MRKIEAAMVAAVREGRAWHGDNTAVTARAAGLQTVTLHGHMIALIDSNHPELTRWTLAGWNTNTTRSRINALARAFGWCGVCTIRGEPHASESAGVWSVWRPIAADAWVKALPEVACDAPR